MAQPVQKVISRAKIDVDAMIQAVRAGARGRAANAVAGKITWTTNLRLPITQV